MLTLGEQSDYHVINSFSVFSFCKDFIEKGNDPIFERISTLITTDPLLNTKFNPENNNRFFNVKNIMENLEEKNRIISIILITATIVRKCMSDFFSRLDNYHAIEKDFIGNKELIFKYIEETYKNLSPEKRAAVAILCSGHRTGILLPMMLVQLLISPSEYALSAVAAQANLGGVTISKEIDSLINLTQINPLSVNWEIPKESFRIIHEQALKVKDFLEFFESPGRVISVISELINQGENDKVEFKSTLRWDIRQSKKNPAIEHAALKTAAAFLNSDGGDLLIGVADDGSIVGVEQDNFPNDDKFLLHFWMLVKTSMGKDVSPYIITTLEKFDGKTVCRVHCNRSPKPVFLRQSGFDEMFYIRIGPSSGALDISEALKYIGEHFE